MGAALSSQFHAAVRARLAPSLPPLLNPPITSRKRRSRPFRRLHSPAFFRTRRTARPASPCSTPVTHKAGCGTSPISTPTARRRPAATSSGTTSLPCPSSPTTSRRSPASSVPAPPTPLSHTNVLATGWGIPNAVIHDLAARLATAHGVLSGSWVRYSVTPDQVVLEPTAEPADLTRSARRRATVVLGTPRTEPLPIRPLSRLRAEDRHAYGAKAANSANSTTSCGTARPPSSTPTPGSRTCRTSPLPAAPTSANSV